MLVGIVGKPSCGKSTFFKSCTLAEVDIANFPFTTIDPNHGVGFVKIDCVDTHFETQCNPRFGYCIDHKRFVPVDLLDVAGLVPGAHKGLGRGNAFLDDLRQADVLIHVIDVSGSTNDKGEPVAAGSYDPANDIVFLEDELDHWYLGILNKNWERFVRQVVQEKQDIARAIGKQLSGLKVTEDMVKVSISKLDLNKEKPNEWSQDELFKLSQELRKLTKPMVIACNKIDVPGAMNNFKRLQEAHPDHVLIGCSAESELALRQAAKEELIKYIPGTGTYEILDESKLSDAQKKALSFIKANILDKVGNTGVQNVMDAAVFDVLKYIAIYPGGVNKLGDSKGNILPDCFLLPFDSTALDFAFKLHTDFGKGFIKAVDVKTKLPVGRDHKLKNGDVLEIFHN